MAGAKVVTFAPEGGVNTATEPTDGSVDARAFALKVGNERSSQPVTPSTELAEQKQGLDALGDPVPLADGGTTDHVMRYDL